MPSEPPIIYDPVHPVAYVQGHIIPVGKRGVTAKEMLEGLQTAILQEYDGDDPKKFGLTKKEAYEKELADQAADGNLSAIGMLLDRTLGKPIQQVNSLNVTTSWEEFLNGLVAANRRTADSDNAPF
jgi:hypothetical protein